MAVLGGGYEYGDEVKVGFDMILDQLEVCHAVARHRLNTP